MKSPNWEARAGVYKEDRFAFRPQTLVFKPLPLKSLIIAMSSNGPDKTSGQFHSVKGNIVEAVRVLSSCSSRFQLTMFAQVGNATGSESWQTSGKQEHAEGEAETTAAKAKGVAQGAYDQVSGYVSSVAGAITGDKGQQASGEFVFTSLLIHTYSAQVTSNKNLERRRRR